MSTTVIGWGDPRAPKKWGTSLVHDTEKNSYWNKKFVGKSENNIIEQKTELESDQGDRISFDLSVELREEPTEGDARLEGSEEHLRFFSDEVAIDQARKAVSAGGRMTRKRSVHNLRTVAKRKLSLYWAKYWDELYFIYLSGARGINEGFLTNLSFTGRANNALQAPDAAHLIYGGAAQAKAEITASDVMTRTVIERANVAASMMHAKDPNAASMVPVTVEGEARYVMVMSVYQKHSLRTSSGSGDWLDIQKAAAGAEGSKSKIFRGGIGMIDNTVLHEHESAIRFNDYGAGSNIPAARALLLARQAGVLAYGMPNGSRGIWVEKKRDYDNEPTVSGGFICGFKKTRYNGKDFGVLAVDTAAADPNAG